MKPVKSTTRPSVSVVVPCYNYGRYLPALVRGLREQPGVELDVVIVDDASPDGSGDVADGLAATFSGVRVIRHRENKGHIQTYNDGLAETNGKYVILLSADDHLPPGSVGRAVSLMEARPDVGLVYGFSQSFVGEVPIVSDQVRNWTVWEGLSWLRLASKRGRCFIASPEVVMRRDALAETAGYDPRLPHSGDFDMWLQTALRWNIGRVNGPAQALYRVHDSNMHLTTFAGMITDLRERRRTFEILFNEHAPERPEVCALRQPAMRALARESARLALRGYRDGAPAQTVDEYLEFSIESWPRIEKTWLWKACTAGPVAGHRLPLASARRFQSNAWNHLRWRRWRRYGT